MQCATTSENASQGAQLASARRAHTRDARSFWLNEALRCVRFAREWRARFGGRLHPYALSMYLEYLLEAQNCRDWAREITRRGAA